MRKGLSGTSIAIAALILPAAALADFSNTQTISSGQHLTMDNGATGTSGGDLLFSGTSITPQGNAKIYSIGPLGQSASVEYSSITSAASLTFFPFATTPITGSSLAANEVFAVLDNAGNYAKVWVTAVNSSSLSITYDTFGAPAGGNTPVISDVLDAGSYTESIAQGSVFVVKGNNLSASGFIQASFPFSGIVSGVSINFTPLTGGSPTQAFIDYLYNLNGVNQLAAILPSTVPVGSYNVTVVNGGATSAAFPVTVVKQKPELITADSTGSGLAVMQNYISQTQLDVNRFTTGSYAGSTISPSHPNQTNIAYTVGMGPDPFADNQPSPGYNFLTNGVTVQVIVGGMTITPSFAGRVAGGSGYEQVNFVLPANVPTGCAVSFQIVENGIQSQTGFISIAPAGSNACVQTGFTTAQLQQFDNGLTVNYGNFSIDQDSTTNAAGKSSVSGTVDGSFVQYTGFELPVVPPQILSGYVPPTGCQVAQFPGTASGSSSIMASGIILDAGNLFLSGPAASGLNKTPLTDFLGEYELEISGAGSTTNASVVPGTYTLTGSGGSGVGAFSANVTLPTPLTVTGGLPTTITRGSGLTLNWTGGNSSDGVTVYGTAATITNGVTSGVEFYCFTTAGAKSLNVSSSILNQLPAISAAQLANHTGSTSLTITTSSPGLFNAPLTGGGTITNATFAGSVDFTDQPVYQ